MWKNDGVARLELPAEDLEVARGRLDVGQLLERALGEPLRVPSMNVRGITTGP